ncbi:MAG: dockerin type I repeat-containing protein, partial [Ruminococcus sp.]|nr:dockerin type I repeat-containing protein [Ruminococcus sp.]
STSKTTAPKTSTTSTSKTTVPKTSTTSTSKTTTPKTTTTSTSKTTAPTTTTTSTSKITAPKTTTTSTSKTTASTTTTTSTFDTTVLTTTSAMISETTTASIVNSTTVSEVISEFYYSGEETTYIFTEDGEVITEINKGNMVNVKEIRNGYGLVTVDGTDGWIDMDKMLFNLDWVQSIKGDINKDGVIDIYDLSLVNEYIKSRELLPDGVSMLSQSEIETADINSDGVVDKGDVIEYLAIIFK